MYYTFITTLAQIILTQRFDVLHRVEYVHSFLSSQNLRNNEEEQVDCGYPVYSCRYTAWSWNSHVRSSCSEHRSILPLHTDFQVPELKENIFTSYDPVYDSPGFVSHMSPLWRASLGNRSDMPLPHLWLASRRPQ